MKKALHSTINRNSSAFSSIKNEESEKADAPIVTFYSYKGGVGRSMALANLAILFARDYLLDVLAVDWDLEAPGLHRFLCSPNQKIKDGIIDYFCRYKERMLEANRPITRDDLALEPIFINVRRFESGGRVRLLSAGDQEDHHRYAKRVTEFDWDEFYKNWNGAQIIEYMRLQLKNSAQLVLIDSRTGITDIGGICTLQLPDIVVLVFSFNEQNITGVESIARNLAGDNPLFKQLQRPRPKILLLPSRKELSEAKLLRRWEKTAAERLEPYVSSTRIHQLYSDISAYIREAAVPYVPYFAYGEELAVNVEEGAELVKAFEDLAEIIAIDLERTETFPERLEPISATRLKKIVSSHKSWVGSRGKEGEQANLSGLDLEDVNLKGANIEAINLFRSSLQSANLEKANLAEANLKEANLQGAIIQGGNLSGADLTRANLQGANLWKADLRGAILRYANLKDCYLREANLKGVDLQRANLDGGYLFKANLIQASLREANLVNATLLEAILKEADLTDVMSLTQKQLNSAVISSGTRLPHYLRWTLLKETHVIEAHTSEVTAIAITPDGRHAVSVSGDKSIKELDIRVGKALRTLDGHTDWVTAVAVSPDGLYVISASADKTLMVWDLKKRSPSRKPRYLRGHTNRVTALAVTSNGQVVISASDDKTLKVWNLKTGKVIRSRRIGWRQKRAVKALCATPDGENVIFASDDITLTLWNIESGKALRALKGHTDWVTSVVVTPDGKRAISASADRTLKVWDLESGKQILSRKRHTDWIRALALTPDGQNVISVSDDRTLKVWEVQKLVVIASFSLENALRCCAVTPDSDTIVTGDEMGQVSIFKLSSADTS